jgi:hypothetical protein
MVQPIWMAALRPCRASTSQGLMARLEGGAFTVRTRRREGEGLTAGKPSEGCIHSFETLFVRHLLSRIA